MLSFLGAYMFFFAELVPSSARSVSSTASPLPTQLVPLLQEPLEKIKEVINKVLPVSKKRTALEEAEWEDEGSENALEREIMLQCMSFLFNTRRLRLSALRSDGDFAHLSTQSRVARSRGDGSRLCCRGCPPSSRGISHPELGFGLINERLSEGMFAIIVFALHP